MGQRWAFTVYGNPVAQGRPRAYLTRSGHIDMYDPEKSAVWKNRVAIASLPYRPRVPSEAPLVLEITFWLMRPKSLPKWVQYHTKKPDLDNLEKGIKDALEGIYYRNDSQICDKHSRKRYGDTPRVEIDLREIDDDEGCSA